MLTSYQLGFRLIEKTLNLFTLAPNYYKLGFRIISNNLEKWICNHAKMKEKMKHTIEHCRSGNVVSGHGPTVVKVVVKHIVSIRLIQCACLRLVPQVVQSTVLVL